MKNISHHCLFLTIASIAIWMTGVHGEFVWIDHVEIEEAGYRVTSWDDFRLVFTSSLDSYAERDTGRLEARGGYFRPVYALSITADWLIWKGQPFAYHLTNIVIHTLVVLALYFLGRLLFPDPEFTGIVFAASLLFAVHPFGVHSVTWISGRKDLLCALFAILSLIGFGLMANGSREKSTQPKQFLTLVLAVLSLNVALLCKELAIVTPAFATLWWWTLDRNKSDRANSQSPRRGAVLLTLTLLWLSGLFALVMRYWLLGGIGLNIDYPADSWLGNISVSCGLVSWYIIRILLPVDPSLVDRWPIPTSLQPGHALSVLAMGTGVVITVRALWQRRPLGLALSWFLIWMLPATGLVPLRHLYAERYLYPASWGLLLSALIIARPWFNRLPKPEPIFGIAIGIVAVCFSIQAVIANQYWKNDETLFRHTLVQDPAYVEGLAAMSLIELDRKEYKSAKELGERAIQSANEPHFRSYWSPYGVYTNTGLAALYLRDLKRAQACFEHAQSFRPNNANASFHLGLAAEANRQVDEATRHYEHALSIAPNHHASRVNLGHILLIQQRFPECISALTPTVNAEPTNHLAQVNLATAYLLSGDYPSAEKHFELAIKLVPQDPVNLAKLAWSEFEQGKTTEGEAHLGQAKQMLPNNPTIRFVEQKYSRK